MKGKCLCGDIEFNVTSEIQSAYYCHCRDCQITSGSAFHVLAIVNADAIRLNKGEVGGYTKQAESGFAMRREFCSHCATPLFLQSDRFPEIKMLLLSALVPPVSIEPTFEIWCDSKVAWATASDNIKSYAKGALD